MMQFRVMLSEDDEKEDEVDEDHDQHGSVDENDEVDDEESVEEDEDDRFIDFVSEDYEKMKVLDEEEDECGQNMEDILKKLEECDPSAIPTVVADLVRDGFDLNVKEEYHGHTVLHDVMNWLLDSERKDTTLLAVT